MKIDHKIRNGKLQYDINKEAPLSSFLTGEEILPSDQSGIIEEAKFTCSPMEKAFGKETKTAEEQEKKRN